MRHRADDNNVPWMDKLVEDEIKGTDKKASVGEEFVATVLGDRNPFGGSVIDRIAADDAAAAAAPPMSMDEIEKKIDSATSVEELDALEDQLKKMNEGGDDGVTDAGAPADAAPDASSPAPDASAPTPDSGADDDHAPSTDGAAPAATAGVDDIASLKGDIGKIKETLDDKQHETNQELLQEIKKLNEAMGADKTVDLNNTIDQSS